MESDISKIAADLHDAVDWHDNWLVFSVAIPHISQIESIRKETIVLILITEWYMPLPSLALRASLALLLSFCVVTAAFAADIRSVQIEHNDARYQLVSNTHFDAPLQDVYDTLIDYDQLAAISKVIKKSHYLEATDHGESVILGRRVPWNLDEYPYVSFRVRIWKIPEGGDERTNDRVDSAAGVYFTVNKKFFGKIPESVKYVWSSTLPVGTAVRRKGIGKPWQVVFGTDSEGLGEWHTYIFDLRQAYRDTFGGTPPSKTEGIGVLSDANSLKAQAYADYDDIRALRTAPPGTGSGVLHIVPPVGNQ